MGTYKRNRPTIGVLLGWQAYSGQLNSYLDNVLYGIQAAAHDQEINLMLACGVGVEREIDLGRPAWPILQPGVDFIPVGPWNTDGLIVIPPLADEAGAPYFDSLKAAGYPLVFSGDWSGNPAVIVDNEGGILQAMAHLVRHGHRRIAFIAGRKQHIQGDSWARLQGYRAGIEKFDLEYDPELIAYGHHTFLGGKQAMRQLLDQGKEFTAVLASNDESAVGAMEALQQAGLLVPQDVALIGFDDRIEARAQIPLLTTVHYPMFEVGYHSVELLLKQIRQPDSEEVIKIPTRLVVRESCGCLAGVVSSSPSTRAHPAEPAPAPSTLTKAAAAGIFLDEKSSLYGEFPLDDAEVDAEDLESRVIIPAIIKVTYNEVLRVGLKEVEYLCQVLEEAFHASLVQADPLTFRLTIQQIAGRVASLGDDLRPWQEAISTLRSFLPALIKRTRTTLSYQQAEDMLHEARVAISEISSGQTSQLMVHQAAIANEISQMTSRFLAAQDEAEVYQAFTRSLPVLGIHSAAVAFYRPEGEDPVAWSDLQTPPGPEGSGWEIPTRQFPPEGLYPANRPFNLALLPLLIPDVARGFVAFEVGNIQSCGVVLRQLEAALRGVRLRQEAEEARRSAEEARRLEEEERKSAEAANQMKSRFLSVVSHELRTPLNLIYSLSSMLLEEGERDSAGQQKVASADLEHIHVTAEHLNNLIRDVLDLAQSDVGQLKLLCEPLDLRGELAAAAVIGQQLAQAKHLTWRLDLPDKLPQVWGDRTRLRQVVLNLVNNAVKFTTQGEVSLSARFCDGKVTVRVEDTGLGIPAEEQEAIFEEFRQSERTAARGYGGLGLGLAICKRLVEMHGGEIGVSSSGVEGQGAAFYFTLPVLVGPAPVPEAAATPGESQRVLIMGNDPVNGDLLKNYLVRQGFDVSVSFVADEPDCFEKLLLDPPDVLILDLGLASQWGWEIIKKLNENPATQTIPVMFYSLDHAQQRGSLLEISYLTKPLGMEALAETLMNHGLLVEDDGNSPARRILVVDDDPGILALHTRMIREALAGYQVIPARNGREALSVTRQLPPDLVLLDLMMPEMDGFAVLEAMREEEAWRNIPVVVLTGQALTEEDMLRLNRGAVSVLSKGMYSADETLQHLSTALLHQRRPGSESQRLVSKAIAYINANYAGAVSLHDVASCVGLSERHLTRCFRQEIGITPTTYLNRLRIKQAKALLEDGDGNSITRIGLDVGFSSSAYFTRVFKEEVGLSPREYLRKSQKCKSSS